MSCTPVRGNTSSAKRVVYRAPQCSSRQQSLSFARDGSVSRQLQLEHNILKKDNELLKKGFGVDLLLLTNREKTLLVDALRQA